ncbi:hybrid sensor histidine kinase/response regulator [Methanolobus psychrotolerans]|uniref:hybrid sensor histidine kinase/response regulator n=1 Tax=Methanolobus psychrotolerans TaxID=1874706 RepID=UPI000B91D14D|nr:ATP-binding protein [Methanolobus psychrotolerans]
MGNDSNIHILFVEDIPSDTELAERILIKDGIQFQSRRVETSEDFSRELAEFAPDLVISDYSLPAFDGMQALKILQEFDEKIPFIIFTGSLNEETAVTCMKAGATDYVLKDRIRRLSFSVREALDKKAALMAQERAESSLLKSEERLKLAMEVSKQGFWDWDMDTNDAYFSSGWYSILGYDQDELPRTFETWKSLLHPDDREFIVSTLLGQLTKLEVFQMDFRMQSRSGGWIWVTGRGKPFDVDQNGVPHRAIGTFIDITSRKLAEQQMLRARIAAEEANRYKNELLANISHELRTPLSSVIGFSDVLLEGLSGNLNQTQKKHALSIYKSGNRLLELINKMLDLSRIESGQMDLSFESFDPRYVLSVVLSRTRSMAAKKGIVIITRIDPNLIELIADVDKITEILYNLVENSLKFTQEGGKVSINIQKEGDSIFISVSDTGIGIKENDKERIFEPFVQVDGSASRTHGGIGLGLMLVREYTKMHNGEIRMESDYGKGSTFTLKLPVCPKDNSWQIFQEKSVRDDI